LIPAPVPANEAERQASLERMNVLATPREPDLDRIARLARQLFGVETALITLLDGERQWFKARYGLDVSETPRDISFCGHAIHQDDLFVVTDAGSDERFHDNPLVTGGPQIRFYAGQPLTNSEGHRIGVLCLTSPQARDVSDAERRALQDLGRLAELVMEVRDLGEIQRALLDELDTAKREALVDPLSGLWNRGGIDILFDREIERATRDEETLSVAVVDIDNFKAINDRFGHAKGDQAIRLAADLLARHARSYDVVGRYGGEEFVVVMKGVSASVLPTIGDKLLGAFRAEAKLPLDGDDVHPFTISIGLTSAAPGNDLTRASLLEAADKALYHAKANGRDRFEIIVSGVEQAAES